MRKLFVLILALASCSAVLATTVTTNGTEVTIEATSSYTYSKPIDGTLSRLIVVGGDNEVTIASVEDTFAGTISLESGSLKFFSSAFSDSAPLDKATLVPADKTQVTFAKNSRPIPLRLQIPSGVTFYLYSGVTTYATSEWSKYNHWAGSIENDGVLYCYGEGNVGPWGVEEKKTVVWLDGEISGTGTIQTYWSPKYSKGLLGIGNAATAKVIDTLNLVYGPIAMVDAGDVSVAKPFSIQRDQEPTANTRLAVSGNTSLTAADIQVSRGGLDILDGAKVKAQIDVAGEETSQRFGMMYVSGAQLEWLEPKDGTPTHIGRQNGASSSKPDARTGMPADGYVLMDGDASIISRGSLRFGMSSRGYYEQKGGSFVMDSGKFFALGGARASEDVFSAAHGQAMIAGGTFKVDDLWLIYGGNNGAGVGGNYGNGFADFTVRGVNSLAEIGCVHFQVTRTQPYSTDGTCLGSTGFINIESGGVLATRHILRDDSVGNWVNIYNTPVGWVYRHSCYYLNFDGGTVRTLADGKFFAASNEDATASARIPNRVTVYEGGAAIDTYGHDVEWSAALEAPVGNTLRGVDINFANQTRYSPARVRIIYASDDDGDNRYATSASAWANHPGTIANKTFGTARITAPGFGLPAKMKVVVDNMHNWPTITNEVSTVPAVATGGLTKRGLGELTLTGVNTYGGKTKVEAGRLVFTAEEGCPCGDIEVSSGAIMALSREQAAVSVKSFSGSSVRITEADELSPDSCRGLRTVLKSDTPLPDLSLECVNSDGSVGSLPKGFIFRVLADGKQVSVGRPHGVVIFFQ